MHTGTHRHFVGQILSYPTLSHKCVLVDYVGWNEVASLMPDLKHPGLPPLKAVVFEVLKNGSALAAYNGRHTTRQLLAEKPDLPVLWLAP